MANRYFVKLRTQQYIADNDLTPMCAADVELALLDVLDENDEEKNVAALDEYRDSHPNIRKSADTRKPIDIKAEREAFGGDATPAGRVRLFKLYGEAQYTERMSAWGATAGSMKAGTEPGASSEETIKKAEAIVKRDEESSRNPFNPKTKYGSDQVRLNEIAKYIRAFGTKASARAAAKYGVDLAGRPLRKSA
jgi:hypothetical protein